MIGHTEQEARASWCPFSRAIVWNESKTALTSSNLQMNGEPATACLGSRCMAWRWVSSLTVDNPTRTPGAAKQEVAHVRGYCGLAGKL